MNRSTLKFWPFSESHKNLTHNSHVSLYTVQQSKNQYQELALELGVRGGKGGDTETERHRERETEKKLRW